MKNLMKKVNKKEELFYDGKIYYRIAFKDKTIVWLYSDMTKVIHVPGLIYPQDLEDKYQVFVKPDGQ